MAGSQGYIFLSLFLPPHVLWEAVVMLSFRYSAMFSVLLWGPSENFNQSWPVITVSLRMNLLHRLHFYSSPVLRRRVLLKFLCVSELICWGCTTSKKDIKCFLFSSCKMALFFLASLLPVKWWWYFFLDTINSKYWYFVDYLYPGFPPPWLWEYVALYNFYFAHILFGLRKIG